MVPSTKDMALPSRKVWLWVRAKGIGAQTSILWRLRAFSPLPRLRGRGGLQWQMQSGDGGPSIDRTCGESLTPTLAPQARGEGEEDLTPTRSVTPTVDLRGLAVADGGCIGGRLSHGARRFRRFSP